MTRQQTVRVDEESAMNTINEIIAAVEEPPRSFEEYLSYYADRVGDLVNEYIPRGSHPDMDRYLYDPLLDYSKNGGKRLKDGFLPGAEAQILFASLFEKIVQKAHEKIGNPHRERNDRRAVRPSGEQDKSDDCGQNKSESAHRGRTAFAFVFTDVREDVLPGFQLAEDGDEQEAEDEGDAERRKRGGEIRFCLHSRYPLQSPRRTSSITALSL